MYTFKCRKKEIGIVIATNDCGNHTIITRIYPNCNNLNEMIEVHFMFGGIFVINENTGDCQCVTADDLLNSIGVHPTSDNCFDGIDAERFIRNIWHATDINC